MVKGVVNTFWFAFFADGLFSIVDEIVKAKVGVPYLSGFRGLLALLVLLMSFGMAGVSVFSPRAPKWVLLPMILFIWWADLCGGFPLQSKESPWFGFCLAAAQLVLATGILVLCRSKGSPWNAPFAVHEKPGRLQWKHFCLTGLGLGTALIVSLLAAMALGLAAKLESHSGGYIRLKRDGIYFVERKFRQGDKEVWLSGMVHVARPEFYQGVLPQDDPALPYVVLLEGVSDRKKLLKGLTYAHLAKLLHLESQGDSEYEMEVLDGLANQGETIDLTKHPKWVRHARKDGFYFKQADVDVETFSPKTIAFLIAVFSVYQSENFHELSATYHAHESSLREKGIQKQVLRDILVSRNEKLESEIDSSLKDYHRVIVPWGAEHLPCIQTWLISHDFVQQEEVERKAIGFW